MKDDEWAWYIARMGALRNAYKILVGIPEGRRSAGRLDVDGRVY